MLTPLYLPPGVVQNGTALESKGRWRDANLVRWVEGCIQPIGRWARVTNKPLPGRINGLLPLRDLSGRRWLVVATTEGVWTLGDNITANRTPEDFVPGGDQTTRGRGYGASWYSLDEYGTPRSGGTGLTLEAGSWSLATWGEFVVGCSLYDGRVLVWRPGDLSTPADEVFLPVTEAPESNRALLVTDERHLMLIAADGDPRKVQWSAREDYTVWAPSALNLAGDLTLETNGTLQVGLKVAGEILVLSEVDAFRLRYVGQPYGYGQERVGLNCGIIGPNAGTATNDFAAWMGPSGFWIYNGQLQQIPCDVWDFVFRDLNRFQVAQVSCGHNAEFNEIWWFFPKGDSERNSHYVAWNYRDNWWTIGALARTYWKEKGVWDTSIAGGTDGHVYEHERRFRYPGVVRRAAPYLESAPFELGQGGRVMYVTQLMPDQASSNLNSLSYRFKATFSPLAPETSFGPFYPAASGFADTRFAGREVQWRVEAERDEDWRLGPLRAEIRHGGRR